MPPQLALARLETAVLEGCATEEEWPARVSAGIYAGVEFAIAHPDVIEWLALDTDGDYSLQRYQTAIARLSQLLKAEIPTGKELPRVTGEALVGGILGLAGEQLRLGRADRLRALRPEFVLLTLLPYMGFDDAREWANRAAQERP